MKLAHLLASIKFPEPFYFFSIFNLLLTKLLLKHKVIFLSNNESAFVGMFTSKRIIKKNEVSSLHFCDLLFLLYLKINLKDGRTFFWLFPWKIKQRALITNQLIQWQKSGLN